MMVVSTTAADAEVHAAATKAEVVETEIVEVPPAPEMIAVAEVLAMAVEAEVSTAMSKGRSGACQSQANQGDGGQRDQLPCHRRRPFKPSEAFIASDPGGRGA